MNERGHQPTGWQLEQSGPDAYEQYLVPSMFAPWAERLIDRVGLQTDTRVLDVACGTGIVARRAASRVGDEGTVIGLDVNESMLNVARATATEDQLPIEWRQGDAADLPFADETFDVVFCQQALQFLPDPEAALAEMHRMLAPGGRVAVSVWRPLEFNPGYVTLAEALEQHVGDEAGVMMRSPFPTWDRDDLRALAHDAGFSNSSITIEIGSMRFPSVEELVRREAASSPLSGPLEDIQLEVREALIHDVENGLREYIDDDGLVFPMESYFLTALQEA